jgi:hypothetical protein
MTEDQMRTKLLSALPEGTTLAEIGYMSMEDIHKAFKERGWETPPMPCHRRMHDPQCRTKKRENLCPTPITWRIQSHAEGFFYVSYGRNGYCPIVRSWFNLFKVLSPRETECAR